MSKWNHLQDRRDTSAHSRHQRPFMVTLQSEEMGRKEPNFHQHQVTGNPPAQPAWVCDTCVLSRLSTTSCLHFNKPFELLQCNLLKRQQSKLL